MEIAHREVLQRSREAGAHAKLAIEEGDLILFAADQWLNACEILGKIRLYCAEVLKGRASW
jgi:aspartyl-tRNA synthetase